MQRKLPLLLNKTKFCVIAVKLMKNLMKQQQQQNNELYFHNKITFTYSLKKYIYFKYFNLL